MPEPLTRVQAYRGELLTTVAALDDVRRPTHHRRCARSPAIQATARAHRS